MLFFTDLRGFDLRGFGLWSVAAGTKSQVKQADVIMIGYPLDLETNKTVRRNDLELYEKVTTGNGPAMTWSMFAIGHLELGQEDKADSLHRKQFAHITQPFQVNIL